MNIKKMLKMTAIAGLFAATAATAAPSLEVFPAATVATHPDSGVGTEQTLVLNVATLGTAETVRIANEVYDKDDTQTTVAKGALIFTCDDVAASQIVVDFAGITPVIPAAQSYFIGRLITTGDHIGKVQPLFSAGSATRGDAENANMNGIVAGVVDAVTQRIVFAAEAGTNLRVGGPAGVPLAVGDQLVIVAIDLTTDVVALNDGVGADTDATTALTTFVFTEGAVANLTIGIVGDLDKNLTSAVTMTAEETVADVTASATSNYASFTNQFVPTCSKLFNGIVDINNKKNFTVADTALTEDTLQITIDDLNDDTDNAADTNTFILAATNQGTGATEYAFNITLKSSSSAGLASITPTGTDGAPVLTSGTIATTLATTGLVYSLDDTSLINEAGADQGKVILTFVAAVNGTDDIAERTWTVTTASADEKDTENDEQVNNVIAYATDKSAGSWGAGVRQFRVPAAIISAAFSVNSTVRIGINQSTAATVTAWIASNGTCEKVTLPNAAGCAVTDYTVASILALSTAFAGVDGNYDITFNIGSNNAEVECYTVTTGAFTNSKVVGPIAEANQITF